MILKSFLKNTSSLILLLSLASCMGEGNDKYFKNENFLNGQRLYVSICQSCHQQDGKGFKALYPPLASSDYMEKNREDLACIIKYGLRGKILVNGIEYNQTMPANENLTSEEIRDLMVYLVNSWGKTEGDIALENVKSALSGCKQ